MRSVSLVAVGLVLLAAAATSQRLVRTEPANGALHVSPDVGVLRLHFDTAMRTDGWSLLKSGRGAFPPPAGERPARWIDARCCELRVKRLAHGTTYAIQLNSAKRRGFATPDGKALPVTVITFTTMSEWGDEPEAEERKVPVKPGGTKRPPCPDGWSSFASPELGLEAWVPPGFYVRLWGKSIFIVQRIEGDIAAAFIVPMRPKPNAPVTAQRLSEDYARFVQKCDPNYRVKQLGGEGGRAIAAFTSQLGEHRVEGRTCAILAANGSNAFVVGVVAAEGKLGTEHALLKRIASGFAFSAPTIRWTPYRSPGGNFTMEIPAGWRVSTTEGRVAKNEIDWVVANPAHPLERAFSITPKFCTPQLMQVPLYQVRGYKVAVFQSPQQCIETSIGQFCPGARVVHMKPNPVVTRLIQGLHKTLAQTLASTRGGRVDIAVYDCLAEGNVDGKKVLLAFGCGINQLVLAGGVMGNSVQTDVWCRGWVAPTDRFLSASPVLDRTQDSMCYTAHYLMRVAKMEQHRAKTVHDTMAKMRRLEREMNREHWRTQDAIYEMYGDFWSEMGGYVNGRTGKIERIHRDKVIRNSGGQVVSAEQVLLEGIPADQATVVRDAYSDDYMEGVYGRITFEIDG